MRATYLFFFQFTLIISFAQKQASTWYFGEHAGLDFNVATPVALQNSALSTIEGSASISDANGDIIFYTDGITVYNKNHLPMKNGKNLWGHYSTTQTLIVPQPESDSIFYIFTMSPQYDYIFEADSVGCHYSIVNLNKENGLGAITVKNVLLFKKTTEKITAVHHANGRDIWVVFHEWQSNCFRSYLIRNNGLSKDAVVSCAGSIHQGGGTELGNNNAIGAMKISPNGNYLSLVLGFQKKFEVFIFDSITGKIQQILSSFSAPTDFSYGYYYGVEFSPNSMFIYYSQSFWSCGINIEEYPSVIWQYSIEKNKSTKIGSFIGTLNALQLGIDGKIYISQCNDITGESDYLAVINNPNREGIACNFRSNAVSLTDRKNTGGLPNFIQSYFLFESPVIQMPNIFTPNGDAYNPVFKPIRYEHVLEADLQIVNRWGKQVFYSREVNTGWNGGNEPPGVYYWLLRYEGKNGKTGTLKGWVHLIR